jgi:hypothetical protein
VLPNKQHTLKMGTELVPEKSEKLFILTRLSIRENFSEVAMKASRIFSAGLLLR